MAEQQTTEARLSPELMAEVCKALNFDPAAFAKRHGDEFVRMYLRTDGMLAYVGEEIVAYLAYRVNECLSKAEYALLSYIEYAGREVKHAESDGFGHFQRDRHLLPLVGDAGGGGRVGPGGDKLSDGPAEGGQRLGLRL